MRTVHQVAELTGVSVRTLHYYDQIGLLKPAATTDAGYRLYDDAALARLQRILLYREVELPLEDIRRLLADETDAARALEAQRALLTLKIERLQRLCGLCTRLMKGEPDMSFDAFDNTEVEKARQQYKQEAQERWGQTEAYRASEQKTAAYGKEDWQAAQAEADELFAAFAALRGQAPEGPEAQALVRRWQEHITRRYYPCTNAILAGLGTMYVADERFTANLDRFGEGTAAFMSQAIAAYCAQA